MSEIRERVFRLVRGFFAHELITGAAACIDTNHGQVHAKNAFSFYDRVTLAAGGTVDYALVVPAGVYVHFQAAKVTSNGGGGIELSLREGADVGADGTLIAPANRHRINSPASALTVRKSPTINDAGTALPAGLYLPKGGAGASSIGGHTGDDTEWVLDHTTYLFRLTNLDGAASAIVAFSPLWYEEDAA